MNGDITFNSNDLQTYSPTTNRGIITNLIDHTNIPDKIAELFAKADANASAIPSITYPTKKITISGAIKGAEQVSGGVVIATDQQDLDNLIDTFKGYFNGKDKNLDIAYGTGTRRYIATANTISVTREQKAPYATFTVEFICTSPFGVDTSATTITNQANYTSATLTVTPTIAGSAPVQYPLITLTIDSLTGTGDYVQITNNNNDQQMLLYGFSLTNGTVIVIDSYLRTVTINGTEVDYLGTFLELEPGANSLTYTDGFTTRQVDILMTYYKRWL